MKKYQYLYAVEKQVNYIFDRKQICKELEDHIDDLMEDLMSEGYSKDEAEVKAVEMMGDAILVGKQLNQIHNPWIGYLLALTRIVIIIIIFILLSSIFPYIKDTVKMLSPIVSENSINVIEINEEIYLSTHKLIIDNLCATDDNHYILTYRCFRRYDYTRTPLPTTAFCIETNGEFGVGRFREDALFGFYGEETLNKKPDEIILLLDNNNEYTLNIEDYENE